MDWIGNSRAKENDEEEAEEDHTMRIHIEYPSEAVGSGRRDDGGSDASATAAGLHRFTMERGDDDPSQELGVTVAVREMADTGDTAYVVAFIVPDGLAER